MGRFETVRILPRGGHYDLHQGDRLVFSIPTGLFEGYEANAVFPPHWRPLTPSHPVRRLFWNPASHELLMAGFEPNPARAVEAFGSTPFRSYLQALWIPEPPVLLTRPFWNPPDPHDSFDRSARTLSYRTQMDLRAALSRLRPPEGWTTVINAIDAYAEELGMGAEGTPAEPDGIRELSLTPPLDLTDEITGQALELLAIDHVGKAFPVLRGRFLAALHALSLSDLHSAAAALSRFGITSQEGAFRPH